MAWLRYVAALGAVLLLGSVALMIWSRASPETLSDPLRDSGLRISMVFIWIAAGVAGGLALRWLLSRFR